MTIPEAVRLVLQAGGVGKSGDLYLLDMGDPVKIVDLAKDMILLHGFEPGVDIEIAFTGVRPGEKLHERLTSDGEHIRRTTWEGLHLVHRPLYYTADEIFDALAHLERATTRGSSRDVRMLLNTLVKCGNDPSTQQIDDYESDEDSLDDVREADAHPLGA